MLQLKEIERIHPEWVMENSPTKHVGAIMKRKAGVLVPHEVPMLSLQDVFSKEEVVSFVESMQSTFDWPEFVVERKIDGLSEILIKELSTFDYWKGKIRANR